MNIADSTFVRENEPRRTVLIVWAFAATFVAIASTGFAIFFWLQARQASMPRAASAPASPFLELPETVIPGRYKWISKSGSESFITLNEDHTFSNKSGTIHPSYRWEITRDSLIIVWLNSHNRLNKLERPGVYVEVRDGVEVARMEKQE
jgi:hypothetical protein